MFRTIGAGFAEGCRNFVGEVRGEGELIGELGSALGHAILDGVERVKGTGKMVFDKAVDLVGLVRDVRRATRSESTRAEIIGCFVTRIEGFVALVDAKADAVALGYGLEVGAGGAAGLGAEIVYVRAQGEHPAQVVVNGLKGGSLSFSAGAEGQAFMRCAYGPPEALSGGHGRNEGGCKFIAANTAIHDIPGVDGGRPGRGYLVAASLGAGTGIIPLLSIDISAKMVWETQIHRFELSSQETELIEGVLKEAPDRPAIRKTAMRVGRFIDRMTPGDKDLPDWDVRKQR